eukprot:4419796-Prymnesium_polylepis.1
MHSDKVGLSFAAVARHSTDHAPHNHVHGHRWTPAFAFSFPPAGARCGGNVFTRKTADSRTPRATLSFRPGRTGGCCQPAAHSDGWRSAGGGRRLDGAGGAGGAVPDGERRARRGGQADDRHRVVARPRLVGCRDGTVASDHPIDPSLLTGCSQSFTRRGFRARSCVQGGTIHRVRRSCW